jgi:hypothetical protein
VRMLALAFRWYGWRRWQAAGSQFLVCWACFPDVAPKNQNMGSPATSLDGDSDTCSSVEGSHLCNVTAVQPHVRFVDMLHATDLGFVRAVHYFHKAVAHHALPLAVRRGDALASFDRLADVVLSHSAYVGAACCRRHEAQLSRSNTSQLWGVLYTPNGASNSQEQRCPVARHCLIV